MIAELLMAVFGWNEVWAPGVGDPANPAGMATKHRPLNAFRTRGFLVGVWTGPDGDMLCVRRCTTNVDADRYASPPGRTMLEASLRGFAVLLLNDAAKWIQEADLRQFNRRHAASDADLQRRLQEEEERAR